LIAKEGDLKNTTTKFATINNINKLVLASNKNYISNLTWSVVELYSFRKSFVH
jgi:hypothetical protein